MTKFNDEPCQNTDRELYREPYPDQLGDYYSNSVHVTKEGAIGMNVGGTVIVLPIVRWHSAALRTYRKEGWQPIETAKDQSVLPWNGESVLICTNHNWGDRVHKARWTDEIHGEGIFSWAVDDCKHGPYPLRGYTQVTHWMPLPAAPEPQEDSCD